MKINGRIFFPDLPDYDDEEITAETVIAWFFSILIVFCVTWGGIHLLNWVESLFR